MHLICTICSWEHNTANLIQMHTVDSSIFNCKALLKGGKSSELLFIYLLMYLFFSAKARLLFSAFLFCCFFIKPCCLEGKRVIKNVRAGCVVSAITLETSPPPSQGLHGDSGLTNSKGISSLWRQRESYHINHSRLPAELSDSASLFLSLF